MPKPDPDEFALLDGLVTSLDAALARIDDGGEEMTPAEQLAVLAVAGVRGILPTLRDERNRQKAALAEGDTPGGAE